MIELAAESGPGGPTAPICGQAGHRVIGLTDDEHDRTTREDFVGPFSHPVSARRLRTRFRPTDDDVDALWLDLGHGAHLDRLRPGAAEGSGGRRARIAASRRARIAASRRVP